jgi:hypothetical protein
MDRNYILHKYRARRKFLFLSSRGGDEMDDKRKVFRVADTNVFTVDDGFSIYSVTSVSADEVPLAVTGTIFEVRALIGSDR